MDPKIITIKKAIEEIEIFQTGQDNFLGFETADGKVAQFIRFEEESWMIDVPIIENSEYTTSLQASELNTKLVIEVVTRMFQGIEWEHLVRLERM